MAATFNGNPRATIISCYSPTNVSEETELVTFYNELSSLVRSIPKHNMLVIGGDINAQIGKNGNNKYSLHNTSNKNGQHHPTRHKLYGHLPPITKTIQVRRTRHAGHCWRSRNELIRDVLLWIPTHGRVKAGRPARTYTQQLCEDTGCCPEDLPGAMNDREEWRERVRDIRATSATWWWWWWWRT